MQPSCQSVQVCASPLIIRPRSVSVALCNSRFPSRRKKLRKSATDCRFQSGGIEGMLNNRITAAIMSQDRSLEKGKLSRNSFSFTVGEKVHHGWVPRRFDIMNEKS